MSPQQQRRAIAPTEGRIHERHHQALAGGYRGESEAAFAKASGILTVRISPRLILIAHQRGSNGLRHGLTLGNECGHRCQGGQRQSDAGEVFPSVHDISPLEGREARS